MSAAELTATEEADMADCDGDKVVTMMDVLQEQEDFEEDANAVLGASDEKNCTYPKGYIKRQALYACLTCCPDANTDSTKRAGVCLACSLACHENHELIELYTKRNFCCDCGNPKFNSHPCQFTPNKTDLNDNNDYNQNFSGLYCVCHRPYPDPEATFEDEMIQCIVCEDWLHSSHLEAKVPPNEQYSEMICKACMEKNEFLYDYSDFAVNIETEDVDIMSTDKVNGVCNGDEKTDTKENGDVDMADVQEKTSAEEKTSRESVEKAELESKLEETADETMEDKQAQNTDDKSEVSKENEAAEEKVPDISPNDKDDTVETSEKGTCDNREEATGDSTVEAKTDEPNTDPNTDKKPQESPDSEDKKSTSEQSSSITDDKTDENTNNSNEIPETSKEDNKVEPDSATSEPTENTDIKTDTETKDEGTVENSEINQETTEGVEKDDLLESIDRIINGDDESREECEEKVDETNGKQDKSGEESKEIDNPPEETENKMDDSNENGNKVVNGEKDENKPQTDVEMEDSTKANEAEIEPSNENKRKLDEDAIDRDDFKKPKLSDASGCVRPKGVKKHFKGATFWPCNFRQKLCTCNECITMYKDLSVLFLIDPEDTVSAYETLGKEKNDGRSSQYEIGMQALSSLDRIQQINALTEYNKMRDKLLDFLKSFKDRKEIVKEEDIRAFFAGMKPKREPDGVYFCR